MPESAPRSALSPTRASKTGITFPMSFGPDAPDFGDHRSSGVAHRRFIHRRGQIDGKGIYLGLLFRREFGAVRLLELGDGVAPLLDLRTDHRLHIGIGKGRNRAGNRSLHRVSRTRPWSSRR